ncbi:MAG: hypothetical protein AAGA96_19770 [Verrucomicrobiota bacterium]
MPTEDIEARYWVDVRDKPSFLRRIILALAGDAEISFEGDLSLFALPLELVTGSESSSLRRATLVPEMDFVRCPLNESSVTPILETLGSRKEWVSDIIHIQISVSNRLQFGAYDQFHRDCVVTGSRVPIDLLSDLKDCGIIRSFEPANEQRERAGGSQPPPLPEPT